MSKRKKIPEWIKETRESRRERLQFDLRTRTQRNGKRYQRCKKKSEDKKSSDFCIYALTNLVE